MAYDCHALKQIPLRKKSNCKISMIEAYAFQKMFDLRMNQIFWQNSYPNRTIETEHVFQWLLLTDFSYVHTTALQWLPFLWLYITHFMICSHSLTSFLSCCSPTYPTYFCQTGLCISSNGPYSISSLFLFPCYAFFLEHVSTHTPPPLSIFWLTPISKYDNQNVLVSQVLDKIITLYY